MAVASTSCPELFKVIMIGDYSGKSCLMSRFVYGHFREPISTIGVDFRMKTVRIGVKEVKLQIWDTAGCERFHEIIISYVQMAVGIMVLYDVTDITTFVNIRRIWIDMIQKNGLDNVVIMFVGTKSDLVDQKVVSEDMGGELAEEYGAMFMEVSAKTGQNVNNAFLELASRINVIRGEAIHMVGHKTCPNCNGLFTDPKMLQCFHVYCKKCLDRMVVHDTERRSSITCPMCLHTTSLAPYDVNGLVTASHISRHNEMHGSPFLVNVVQSLDKAPVRSITNLNGPRGVAVNYEGEIFVSESDSKCVSIFSPTGEKLSTITGEDSKHGPLGTVVRGVAMVAGNKIIVLDSDIRLVRLFSRDGKELKVSEPLLFQCPNGVCVNKREDSVYVVDHLAHCIKRLNPDLSIASTFGSAGQLDGEFNFPFDIAIDSKDNVYVTDTDNHRVQVFTPGGKYVRQFGSEGTGPGELRGPIGICIDSNNLVYVGELHNKRVSVFTIDGDFVTSFGTEGSELGQFDGPFGLAIDRKGVLYVSDFGNKRVQLFS